MKTRTIFHAYSKALEMVLEGVGPDGADFKCTAREDRVIKQLLTFAIELRRRMDAGDEWRLTFPCHTPGQIVGALALSDIASRSRRPCGA